MLITASTARSSRRRAPDEHAAAPAAHRCVVKTVTEWARSIAEELRLDDSGRWAKQLTALDLLIAPNQYEVVRTLHGNAEPRGLYPDYQSAIDTAWSEYAEVLAVDARAQVHVLDLATGGISFELGWDDDPGAFVLDSLSAAH